MPDIIYMLNICSDCMQVLFVGEEAIDEGGPKQEFFRLLAMFQPHTPLVKSIPNSFRMIFLHCRYVLPLYVYLHKFN